MSVISVNALPEFIQNQYPPLPQIPEGHFLILPGSAWQNAEKEWAIGILITGCTRSSEWKAIDASTYTGLVNAFPMGFRKQDIINAFWELVNNGELELVEFEGLQYVIIPAITAHNALKGRLMFI